MNLFIAVISTVSALATVAAVWFAWRASIASSKATQDAHQAVRIAAAARAADRRYRQRMQLQEIWQLAQKIRLAAATTPPRTRYDSWRCGEQDQLEAALIGVGPDLPQCLMLAQAKGWQAVVAVASGAEQEVQETFRTLADSWSAEGEDERETAGIVRVKNPAGWYGSGRS